MASLIWTEQNKVADKENGQTLLSQGATLGLFAPSHTFDRAELKRGKEVLSSWGFTLKEAPDLCRQDRYLAGDDAHRFASIKILMEDDTVDALVAVRGGYGCQRLLPLLAPCWDKWPAKPIFGFSDLTALHLARYQKTGAIGYHSPLVANLGSSTSAPNATSVRDFRAKLSGKSLGKWSFAAKNILQQGQAQGPLLGGNLSLLVSLLASPWLPDFKGSILLLEDVGEVPYRLDRLFTILRQSPIWRVAKGLVLGSFTACGPQSSSVRHILLEAAADFDGPVVWRAPFGHAPQNRTFPVGALGNLEI